MVCCPSGNTGVGMNKSLKIPSEKMKITLSVSRTALAAMDRIGAKRLEEGANRREIQPSTLVEEAIGLLRLKEGI
jgi:hypothetical protein